MAQLLAPRTNSPPAATKSRRVPAKIKTAIGHLVAGTAATVTEAAEKAGLSREYLSRSLGQAHVDAYFDKTVRRSLLTAKGRASARLIGLIDARSEHVALDASTEVLALGGIARPERTGPLVNIDISPGYVVKLKHAADDGEATIGPAGGVVNAGRLGPVIDHISDDAE